MLCPSHSVKAFSLIEIVLALGIIAFALVGIMGLFPVAMKSAQESQRETRATHIAQQIFSDLRTGSPTNLLIGVASNLLPANTALSNSWSNTISFDVNGSLLGSGQNANAIFLAQVSGTPNTPSPGLSRVQVDVEAPAVAATTNRSRYTFVTLMNY